MSTRSFVSACVVALLVVGPLAANAETILCRIDPGSHPAYIAPEIRIVTRGLSEASVADSIIASTGRKAVVGEIDRSRTDRLRVIWQVPEVRKDPFESRPGPVKLGMRLTIDRPGGAARLAVQDLLNRKYSYSATGRCTVSG